MPLGPPPAAGPSFGPQPSSPATGNQRGVSDAGVLLTVGELVGSSAVAGVLLGDSAVAGALLGSSAVAGALLGDSVGRRACCSVTRWWRACCSVTRWSPPAVGGRVDSGTTVRGTAVGAGVALDRGTGKNTHQVPVDRVGFVDGKIHHERPVGVTGGIGTPGLIVML